MFERKLLVTHGTKIKLIGAEKLKIFLSGKSHYLLTSL